MFCKRGLRKKDMCVLGKKKKSSFRVYFLALFSNINIKPKQVFITGGYINDNPSAEMSKLLNRNDLLRSCDTHRALEVKTVGQLHSVVLLSH